MLLLYMKPLFCNVHWIFLPFFRTFPKLLLETEQIVLTDQKRLYLQDQLSSLPLCHVRLSSLSSSAGTLKKTTRTISSIQL